MKAVPNALDTILMQYFLGWLRTHGEAPVERDWQWVEAGQGPSLASLRLGEQRWAVVVASARSRHIAPASPGLMVQEGFPAGLRTLCGRLEADARAAGVLDGWFELTLRTAQAESFMKSAVYAELRQEMFQGMRRIQTQPFGETILSCQHRQVAYLVKIAPEPSQLECTLLESELASAAASQDRLRESLLDTLSEARDWLEQAVHHDPSSAEIPKVLLLLNTHPWADAPALRQALELVPAKASFQAIFGLSQRRVLSLLYSQEPRWSYASEEESI